VRIEIAETNDLDDLVMLARSMHEGSALTGLAFDNFGPSLQPGE